MAGESGGLGASFSTSFTDINTGLFGTDTTQTGTGTGTSLETSELTSREAIDVDKAGILKMIEDILTGTGGLAEIFSAEGAAGLFGSSVAKGGTEDLLAKIAGEIAKVTAVKTATQTGVKEAETESATTQEAESPGLLSNIPIIGGLF